MPSSLRKNSAALLLTAAAGSLLVSQAQASVILESSVSGADFSNTFAGRNLLAAGVDVVQGADNDIINGDSDYFTFTNLTPNTAFSLKIDSTANGFSYAANFSVLNDSATSIGTPSIFIAPFAFTGTGTISGTVPITGNLTVFVDQAGGEQSGGSYTATLTAVPEPATTTLAALGAAALVAATRKKRHQG